MVKAPRHPDGVARIDTGLNAALAAVDAGVPAVRPLVDHLVVLDTGPVSVWPYVAHDRVAPADLDLVRAARFGGALGAVARVPRTGSVHWDPFVRFPFYLSLPAVPARLRDVAADLCGHIQEMFQAVALPVAASPWVPAHGDVSVSNALFTADEALLIDFDSAGMRPAGWDLACLSVHLGREAGNDAAFEVAADAWRAASRTSEAPPGFNQMELVKVTMSTMFGFTLEPTGDRHAVMAERFAVLRSWLTSGVAPRYIPQMP
jgi:hypothetical protein